MSKTLLAHITFVRFLVRVNTHVAFQIPDSRKRFSHTSHSYGFSFVWIRMWTFKLPDSRKRFSHTSHSYGFSFVWIRMCLFKPLDDEKLSRTHHIHTVSRSCEYACGFAKYQIHVKRFSHTSHSYGFSFVWIRMWLFKLPVDEKLYRTHRTRTVSRSCEYACGFANYQID